MMKNSCEGFVTFKGDDAFKELGKSVSRRKSYFTTIQSTEFFSQPNYAHRDLYKVYLMFRAGFNLLCAFTDLYC